jgi:hypothetical protein
MREYHWESFQNISSKSGKLKRALLQVRRDIMNNEYIEVEILALYLKHRFLRNLTMGPSELFVRGMPF